jgi:hypothetical protein
MARNKTKLSEKERIERAVRKTIKVLNDNYGKGEVFMVDLAKGIVTIRIWITGSTFGRPERFRFRFDGKTVYYRGHQQLISKNM